MKDYRKLKNNEQVKLELFGSDVRVFQGKFDENTGEKVFVEVLITNEPHLISLESDLAATLERLEDEYSDKITDLRSRISGTKALRIDVKKLIKEDSAQQQLAPGKTTTSKPKRSK